MAAGEIEGRAPIWQSNFVIGPNVRFTRTPDSAYPKRSPKSPPMLEMVQISEQPNEPLAALTSDMIEADASLERPEMTQTFDIPTDFATARGALALALKLRREFSQPESWPQAQIEAPRADALQDPLEVEEEPVVTPVIDDAAIKMETAPSVAPRAFSFAINDAIFFETLLSNPDFDPSLSLVPAPAIRDIPAVEPTLMPTAHPVLSEKAMASTAPANATVAFRASPESVTALYRVIEVGATKSAVLPVVDEGADTVTLGTEQMPQAAPEPIPADIPMAPDAAETEAPAAIKPRIRAAQVLAGRLTPSLQLSAAARAIDLSVLPEMEGYQLPPVDLLQEPVFQQTTSMSQEALEQSAGLLESVLEDFGVRGEIIDVRPGPVVTLYEFEPAPGVKSSRVIGLSDDIARSMSALSARVAVVPGRNVIGIELPNPVRETVYFREMIESHSYEETKFKLPLCLGKTIGGEPVVAELAKMPHLLVAGTTGSGKSVAINTMILSLLYRLKPEECRLIMVDPKMLELSIYDGIPHLLTPVVTDPKKAVMALKWAVREMEDRYRKMSRLGVRNIDGYNSRAAIARAKGETVFTTVQTGFDRGSGEPVFEEQELDLAPMPYIVIIVDEMADLMMVAGKEIEGAIQRLAQMARAAGIHLIMATQRPSVDVITGTIKANFPTRISFQVTSKIDSRTILGEQGAEHLLGQGDMLHMIGGGRIARVHGPFVSDEEVEKVVNHLKAQGRPEYLGTVTEDADEVEESPEEDTAVFDKSGMAEEDGQDLYDKAVKVVLRDKKCSTSYIQRRLQIGYNRAASLVERMEREGLVGAANHVGKRSIIAGGRDAIEPVSIEPAVMESDD
ncbi:cell division protein FtsK [Rhizobium sp. Leaf384]|uniref:DNA translocase FtsK n=1 Tax=unclassified Rhizobium TaxID=2613769 RepID=UPI0007142C06|nr:MULTISPECIES: DNA translocase FtsK [unclassified Rhizobium]KQS76329.1 cell division protein FtsK [Rhizobium sp. Leaf384]KQS78651.1 cell division protein FtsK [Rhizobium sp. Leaf383]